MAYVVIIDNVVTDKVGGNPFLVFGQEYAAQFVGAPNDVQVGWLYDEKTGEFSMPPEWEITEEKAIAAFKAQRQILLSQTDWWAVRASEPGSTPMTEEQLAYRQALRVMDDAEDFDPFNPQWPAEPGA